MEDKNMKDTLREQFNELKHLLSSYSGEDLEKAKKIFQERKLIAKDAVISKSADMLDALDKLIDKSDENVQNKISDIMNRLNITKDGFSEYYNRARLTVLEKATFTKEQLSELENFLILQSVLTKNAVVTKFNDLLPAIITVVEKGDVSINRALAKILDKLYNIQKK